jgi:hypothetical protein
LLGPLSIADGANPGWLRRATAEVATKVRFKRKEKGIPAHLVAIGGWGYYMDLVAILGSRALRLPPVVH